MESFFATSTFSPHAGHAGFAEALGTSVSKFFPHFLQTYSKMGMIDLLILFRGNLHPFSESCKRLRRVSLPVSVPRRGSRRRRLRTAEVIARSGSWRFGSRRRNRARSWSRRFGSRRRNRARSGRRSRRRGGIRTCGGLYEIDDIRSQPYPVIAIIFWRTRSLGICGSGGEQCRRGDSEENSFSIHNQFLLCWFLCIETRGKRFYCAEKWIFLKNEAKLMWCPERDSNPHGLPDRF